MLSHLPEYLKPVATIAYITGWRVKSEVLTRQWRHVDFNSGWLRLQPGNRKTPKAANFPSRPKLRTILEAQRERVPRIGTATWAHHPVGILHGDGSPVRNFRHAWAQACKDAGVPGRLVHDFPADRRTQSRTRRNPTLSGHAYDRTQD